MMRTFKLAMVVAAFTAAQQTGPADPLPPFVADAVGRIQKFYAGGVSTASRVQLMAINPKVFVDPTPTADSFADWANIVLTVDGPSGFDFVDGLGVLLRRSDWRKASFRGYPRWCWRLIDASGIAVMEVLVDTENSAVCCDGTWYVVDPDLTTRLTQGFIEFATNQLVGSEAKDAPAK